MNLLPWQQAQWQQLCQTRQAQRMPHALLLTGAKGLGKQDFALNLAQSLLCQQPDAELLGCGRCRDCRLFHAGNHPDWRHYQPLEGSTVIKIDQIRQLAAFTQQTSQSKRGRIALINLAEQLNSNAANALLKTLEEPPAGVLIILLCSQLGRLSATLRSRCQKLIFVPPGIELAKAWLLEQGIKQHAEIALKLAHDAPLTAVRFADEQSLKQRKTLFNLYQALQQQQLCEVTAAEQWLQYDLDYSVDCLLSWHMDMVRLSLAEQTTAWADIPLENPDLAEELALMTDRIKLTDCFRRYDAIVQLRQDLRTQRNTQMLLEAFFCSCQDD